MKMEKISRRVKEGGKNVGGGDGGMGLAFKWNSPNWAAKWKKRPELTLKCKIKKNKYDHKMTIFRVLNGKYLSSKV